MTQRTDITAVLDQMRMMRTQLQRPQSVAPEIKPNQVGQVNGTPKTPGFEEMFAKAINSVNAQQQTANTLRTSYEQGDPSVDITRVMIESQKASVSFQALTQVRNKMVQAYEDIMKMPV